MRPSAVLFVFLQLCCFQMMLVSRPLCKLPGHLVNNTHHQLRNLGPVFPRQCRLYNDRIIFPESILYEVPANQQQCHWTSLVVYESMREAGLMFVEHEEEGRVPWDKKEVETYLSVQDRVVEDHQCHNTKEASSVLSPYFNNVTAVVAQQDSSSCGWEALRRDLLKVLKFALKKHHGCFNWTRAHV